MQLSRLLALMGVSSMAAGQLTVPYCLQQCLTETNTQLCGTNALPALTSCIIRECLNPPATQNLIANLDIAYSPKALYSCQQSNSPGGQEDSVILPLNESCSTSPYNFRSFIPEYLSGIGAENGCQIIIYGEEDCLGEAMSADIGVLGHSGQKCVFHGGRSARLVCADQLDAARAFIHKTCGTNPSSGDDLPSTSSATASSTSMAGPTLYTSPNLPTSLSENSSPSITSTSPTISSLPTVTVPVEPPLTITSEVSLPTSVMGTATWPSTWLANDTWSLHTYTETDSSTADGVSMTATPLNGSVTTHTITISGSPMPSSGGMNNGTFTSMMAGAPSLTSPAYGSYTGAAVGGAEGAGYTAGLAALLLLAFV